MKTYATTIKQFICFNIEIYVHAPARAKKDKTGVSQESNIFFDVQVMYILSFK